MSDEITYEEMETSSAAPWNYCPSRGEPPHADCDVGVYEDGLEGGYSHLFAACGTHRTLWHLISRPRPWPDDLPRLTDHLDGS